MTEALVWAQYLQGDEISMRPPEEQDADHSARWHESLLPLTSVQALESLRASETVPWGNASTIRLIVGMIADGDVVGGIKVDRHDHWVESLTITPSRLLPIERQHELAVRMLRIVVPWLIDEVAVSSVTLGLPDDHHHLHEAAVDLAFRRNATYREHIRRPHGFVDLHRYQLLNPNWIFPRGPETDHV